MSESGPSGVTWSTVLTGLVAGEDQSRERAAQVMREIMSGNAESAAIAAWLVAMQAKGATADEIAGCVETMVANAERVEVEGPLLDTCGTGGDGASTLNVSTLGALVVAATGVRVAKHGNRAASGTCGAADLLEAWGLAIDLDAKAVATTIDELGIGFMFARTFHPAMRHVAPVRKELGVTTIMNLLGPLANPARVRRQVVGVAHPDLLRLVAESLRELGHERALVVHGEPGLDELSPMGPTRVLDLREGEIGEHTVDPSDFGWPPFPATDLAGGDPGENASRVADVIAGEEGGGARAAVVLNAAAALWVAGIAADLSDGVGRAEDAIDDGRARAKLERLAAR